MCDRCQKLDEKIESYRRLMSRINDQLAHDGIEKLVEEMLAQKAAFHPEQNKQGRLSWRPLRQGARWRVRSVPSQDNIQGNGAHGSAIIVTDEDRIAKADQLRASFAQ
jgi:hypothetical protein